QQLLGQSTPKAIGTPVTVSATEFHPAAEVTAGRPVRAQLVAGKVAAGLQLVAVPLRMRNDGVARWDVPVGAEATVLDSLGDEHHVATTVTAIKKHELLGALV